MTSTPWYAKEYLKAMKERGRIIPQVSQYLVRDAVANSGKRDTKFLHPSEICKKDWCPRSSWYVIKDGARPEESLSFQRMNIFAEGTAIHNKWQKWLMHTGILEGNWRCNVCEGGWYGVSNDEGCPYCSSPNVYYREVPISNEEYHLLGHSDGIIADEKGRAILEIKSVGIGTLRYESPELFAKYQKGQLTLDKLWKEIKTPFASHLRQINLYMFCLGINEGVILYEWKPTQEVKEFEIKFQRELIESILAGCSTVKSALDAGTTPMRPLTASLDAPMCKNCPHYNRCWSIDEDSQDNPGQPAGEVPVAVSTPEASGSTGTGSPKIIRRSL